MEEHPGMPDERESCHEIQAWKPVVVSRVEVEGLPMHPECAESAEDELTRAALSDPGDVACQEPDPHPTFWRVLIVGLIVLGALSVVFRFGR